MNHTYHLFSRLAGGLFCLLVLCIAPSFAQVVFDGSPGATAPPTTLGPYSMTPFGPDPGAIGANVNTVASPNVCGARAINFAPGVFHRRIGQGWATWSHGYTGDVYEVLGDSVTITLPAGTSAFYFYAEPNLQAVFTIQATANDGTTSGLVPVQGNAGARYYGFYTTGPAALSTITITADPGAIGLAIGEFGISCQPVQGLASFPSDQRAGSFLVFPYYTSRTVDRRDTLLTISNVSPTTRATVHVFFIDGATCLQQDTFLCLTPNASLSFNASVYDPEVTGFLYAVAIHPNSGIPIPNNVLIGNAFVRDGEYVGNYGAEAFWAHGSTRGGAFDPIGQTAILSLGSAYDAAPGELSVEVQSPLDKPNQKLVVAPVAGDLNYLVADSENALFFAAAQSASGLIFNQEEKGASFANLLTGTCLRSTILTSTHPRIPSTVGNLIRSGQAGSLKIPVTAAVGLLMTPRSGNNTWNGIRTLHKTRPAKAIIQIPVFAPVC